MNAKLEQTTSVWMQSGEIPVHAALTADVKADVCVVGAGIAGMTTAYLLLQEGRSVVVLDDGPVGGGQTQRTTAHLSNAIDDRYVEIEGWHGPEGARLAAESHTAAIDRIAAIVARQRSRGNIPSQYNGTIRWPMGGTITQEFGCTGFSWEPPLGNCAHFHQGIDIAAPMYTPIKAAAAGVVVFAGPNPYDPYPKAWIVIIAHSESLQTWYAHVDNAARPPAVHSGQAVNAGQVIAYIGMTGRTTGPHLHWAVMHNGSFVNPRLYL